MIYGRLGQLLPSPDLGQAKGPDNYAGRILATIFTVGIYLFWRFYNQMGQPPPAPRVRTPTRLVIRAGLRGWSGSTPHPSQQGDHLPPAPRAGAQPFDRVAAD